MKTRFWLAAVTAMTVTACGPSIRVTTTVAPDASFTELRKFRILTPPARRDGRRIPNDPMLVNSITNQALLTNITDAFIGRGYALDPAAPDFTIAYYASARERLDVTQWNYGYPGRWDGWHPSGAVMSAVPYTEGTVIIDVINPKNNELLWRGRGQSVTSTDPAEFQKDLRDAVQAIVRKFPAAVTHIAARN
ncbi:MAG: DUF4136 domain-containing protein [Gemmatimonadales bacterium]